MMPLNGEFSRNALIAASAYRRMARERPNLDFSRESLREQMHYETFGGMAPDDKVNGYTCGKWILDATLKQMREDHQTGLMTKYELCQGSCYFVRREVKRWLAAPFYASVV